MLDLRAAVEDLSARGEVFDVNDYTDEKGIMRDEGPYIAWFTDPAGNVLSVLQER